ncbi:hypothetical protein AGLY_012318 [Aphis glycines]|uniref:Uncharacterized protein n=1 Tax=Aphis glycines TaxID=307491 RepID=A0A6G0T9R8_APHGL|nr:hypothetical protein AGLY_012318 [Aphis glycines]
MRAEWATTHRLLPLCKQLLLIQDSENAFSFNFGGSKVKIFPILPSRTFKGKVLQLLIITRTTIISLLKNFDFCYDSKTNNPHLPLMGLRGILEPGFDSERSDECIDFTMIITSRNNAPISNYGGGSRCKSEYHWCIIQVKIFKKIEKNKKKNDGKTAIFTQNQFSTESIFLYRCNSKTNQLLTFFDVDKKFLDDQKLKKIKNLQIFTKSVENAKICNVDKIFLALSKYLKILYKVPHMHNFFLLAFEVQILTKIRYLSLKKNDNFTLEKKVQQKNCVDYDGIILNHFSYLIKKKNYYETRVLNAGLVNYVLKFEGVKYKHRFCKKGKQYQPRVCVLVLLNTQLTSAQDSKMSDDFLLHFHRNIDRAAICQQDIAYKILIVCSNIFDSFSLKYRTGHIQNTFVGRKIYELIQFSTKSNFVYWCNSKTNNRRYLKFLQNKFMKIKYKDYHKFFISQFKCIENNLDKVYKNCG